MKNIRVFYLKIFRFCEVKFSIYLNRRVFVMEKTYSGFIHFMTFSLHAGTVKPELTRFALYALIQ